MTEARGDCEQPEVLRLNWNNDLETTHDRIGKRKKEETPQGISKKKKRRGVKNLPAEEVGVKSYS